jgi:hypothetical protein
MVSGVSSNSQPEVASAAASNFAVDVASRAAMRVLSFQHRSFINRRGRPTVDLSGAEANAQVDRETGILVKYQALRSFRPTNLGTQEVTADQALGNARAFAERAGISPDAWHQGQIKYLDHGSGDREYEVVWDKSIDGIRLPAAIDVDVDAETGSIDWFSIRDDPVVVSLQPRISVDQAASVVAARMGYIHPVADTAELMVWYRPSYPGRQALLWRFENMRDASAPGHTLPTASVDAMTGEIAYLWQNLGGTTPGMKHSGVQRGAGSPDKPAPVLIKDLKKINLAALKTATPPATAFQAAPARKK